MNAQKDIKVGYGKALAALTAALCCLAIYILACVMSPVTWSPDSSKIALLVTPPGETPERFAIFAYDIAAGERVLLDRVEVDGLLSAAAWSPDGKWIAYYKVEPSETAEPPSDPNTDPNDTSSIAGDELFSEENRTLPPFLFELLKEKMVEEEDPDTFDVKLMIVSPDGAEHKTLRVTQSQGDEDARRTLVYSKPQWSADSRHLFYARVLGSGPLFYMASLDISNGQTRAHLLSSIGTPAPSPNGKWVASLLEADSDRALLALAQTDGSAQKYFKLDVDMGEGRALLPLTWTPDSQHILIPTKEEFWLTDIDTGSVKKYGDLGVGELAFGTFSPDGRKLYYIAPAGPMTQTHPKKRFVYIACSSKTKQEKRFLSSPTFLNPQRVSCFISPRIAKPCCSDV
jgi:Tol biopolymer transport system component